jgi:Lrp/AsnC family leucine-responsive transcriptional regulator
MDSFDTKILQIVQENNRYTAEELSQKVGLSPTACQRRLKQLRDNGTILKDISVVSPKAVGRQFTMIVEVSLEREHITNLEAFKKSMRAMPEVMQCYYVTGQADFILVLTAESMEDYVEFTNRFFVENPNVRRFHTSVVMDSVKVGLSIPISTAAGD